MKTTDPQDEIFAVVNENDEVVGKTTRKEANSTPSIIHRCITVLVFNEKNEVLLQKRSETKDTNPGYWSYSVGGHVVYGDEYLETALRETEEELGIEVTEVDLVLLGKLLVKVPWESELYAVYKYIMKQNESISFNKEEVAEVKFVSVEELRRMMDTPSIKMAGSAKEIFEKFIFS